MRAYAHTLLAALSIETTRGVTEPTSLHRFPDPRPPIPDPFIEPLSPRELEVLRLIAAGQSNPEIARTLVVAISTVKAHINSIFGKLGVTSRTQAIVRARDLHLL